MDEDLDGLGREDLVAEVRKLRAGIREHRDATGHELCWYQPALWGLLPEKIEPKPAVPPKDEFLRCCAIYRASLGQVPGLETAQIKLPLCDCEHTADDHGADREVILGGIRTECGECSCVRYQPYAEDLLRALLTLGSP